MKEKSDMEHEKTVNHMAEAFRKVLSEGVEGGGQRTILIKRIPIICNDILQIKSDLSWIKWLMMGIVGGVGALALTYLTKLHA